MKVTSLFILLVFFVSCSQKENKTNSDLDTLQKVNTNLITAPKADGFYLKYRFKKNDKLQYRITTISDNNQQINADTMISTVSHQNVQYLTDLFVKEIDNNQNAIIDFTIKSIISEGTINGEKITYDSKYIFSTQERMMFAQYEAIKNKTFTLKIAESGEILDIFNMEEITDELLNIQQQTEQITIEQKQTLIQNFKDAAIRPLSQQLFRHFPSKQISVNYNWEDKYYTKFAVFDIENIASYQVKKVDAETNDSLVTISAGLSINWMGSHEATDQGVKYYFYDPIVSGSGLITFNKTKGLITHSETSSSLEFVMDMEGYDAAQKLIKGKRTDLTVNKNIIELLNPNS